MLRATEHILKGGCVLIATDNQRAWLKTYALTHLNAHPMHPLIPVFDPLQSFQTYLRQSPDISLVRNTLDLVYQNYIFWYVGADNSQMARLALSVGKSLWWLLDNPKEGAICFESLDPLLDHKLLQLYRVFVRMVLESLLGQVNLND
ncbi:HobA family DNA replication regulator [Helicobacter gastrocanis]|uniref:HobA family DNA replication regulator n=1 Tax=Helicobacter gastrocanis TaxID=2849641 RepID=UPI001C86652C|nr:HobA family DNA replication regulator [Helicobacter sp. NHP19-003]